MKTLKIFLFYHLIFLAKFSFATSCPISPMKIEPILASKVSYDKKDNLYTYTYKIENGHRAQVPLYIFRIVLSEEPKDILSPTKWMGRFDNSNDPDFPKNMEWAIPKFYMKAGDKAEGFSFKSSRPPGLVKYYATASPEIPVVTATPENAEPDVDCPGFLNERPVLEGYVNGITQGPSPLNQISVDIKVKKVKLAKDETNKKENDSEDELNEISPYKESGKVAVVLKSNKDLDVRTVNISSVQFGTGKAPVLESSIRGEKNHEELRMVFDLSQMLIECDRDRVLFFSGKTTLGKDLLGAAPIKTVNCDVKPHKKGVKHEKMIND